MNEGTQATADRRSPWLAGLLSFILPGIGQVYCGKLVRGLVFGIVYGLAIPATLGLLAYVSPAPTVLFGLLAFVAALGVVAPPLWTPTDWRSGRGLIMNERPTIGSLSTCCSD